MTVEELKIWQGEFENLIYERARQEGLLIDGKEPIYDGVVDETTYLKSDLRVAWVLKEAYADEDADGNPYGGGWQLRVGFSDENHDENWVHLGCKLWTFPTWQKIAYVMYGYQNGLYWNNLPWMSEQPSMMESIKSIALINVSKMPAKRNSCDGSFRRHFHNYWESIVHKQIEVYDPDVLIFGNTFSCFEPAWKSDLEYMEKTSNDCVWHYKFGKRHLLDTYHPAVRKSQAYVDALIRVLNSIKKPC